jgi:excisionase family DNA binding protein
LTAYLHDSERNTQEDFVQNAALPRLAYSPDEVMIMLGIGKTMLYDLLASGELRSVKRGGRRFIARAHLDAFLEVEA